MFYMTSFFKKNKKGTKKKPLKKKKEDLMDPVLYIGGLDTEKFPYLSQEKKEDDSTEIENPLNKR